MPAVFDKNFDLPESLSIGSRDTAGGQGPRNRH